MAPAIFHLQEGIQDFAELCIHPHTGSQIRHKKDWSKSQRILGSQLPKFYII